MKKLMLTIAITTLAVFTNQELLAQYGVSSASVGGARAGIHRVNSRGKYIMPQPDFFRVEEFINYHRHEIPVPEKGTRVQLDVQNLELENGKTVYQFGIATPRNLSSEELPPLNLVLVVDESGSMSGDKIENLKSALHTMVEQFRKNDRITIVGFTQSARVILEAQEKTNISKIFKAIDRIHAGGSTNLHAGLMCGYEMAFKHFDPERTNRMIFLTDGNANVGVTESSDIARESKRCIKEGISLVTIALGVDMNNGLLREIADSGRGLMHYVGDAKDIKKVFVKEIESVLAPAAQKVRLKVRFAGNVKTPKVFGYEKDCESRRTGDGYELEFKLDNLNHGATQVVMVRVPDSDRKRIGGKATLSYKDVITKKECSTSVDLGELAKRDGGRGSVKRNYAIAMVANSIRSAAKASNNDENEKAARKLANGIEKAKLVFNDHEDKNVRRMVKIANEYREQVDTSLQVAQPSYKRRSKFK